MSYIIYFFNTIQCEHQAVLLYSNVTDVLGKNINNNNRQISELIRHQQSKM